MRLVALAVFGVALVAVDALGQTLVIGVGLMVVIGVIAATATVVIRTGHPQPTDLEQASADPADAEVPA